MRSIRSVLRSRLTAASSAVFVLGVIGSVSTQEPTVRAPSFELSADVVLEGDPITVRITGLEPSHEYTVTAERAYGYGRPRRYATEARFAADAAGVVDVTGSAPLAARWEGVDPRGLFWSMRTTDDAPTDERPRDTVFLAVRVAGIEAAEPLARGSVRLRTAIRELVETPLGAAHPGAFLLRPAGDARLPALIVLGGSEGGDSAARARAPAFASRGYAVVGLPYYAPAYSGQTPQFAALPRAFHDIPLDRLEQVRDWLRARDDVDAEHVGLYGVSKGAEFVLAAASRIDGFAAVAAIVPSDVIWEAWGPGTEDGRDSCFSWRGEPLPFVPYSGMAAEIAKYRTGETVRMRTPHDAGRRAHADRVAAARIDVAAIDEPVFVVGGDADDTWDSGGMARNILAARDAAGLETVAIVDEVAGHGLSGNGFTPTRAVNARVQGRAFPALLAFFDEHLQRAGGD